MRKTADIAQFHNALKKRSQIGQNIQHYRIYCGEIETEGCVAIVRSNRMRSNRGFIELQFKWNFK